MAIDLARLRAVFLEEFEEHCATLQRGLLELERDPSAAKQLLPELFRAAHTVKGGAQAVRLPRIAAVCHRLEEVLDRLRTTGETPGAALLASLFEEVDTLQRLGADIVEPDAPELAPPTTPAPRAPAPAAAAPATSGAQPAGGTPSRPALRVPARRLDVVLDRAGEVLLVRDRLTAAARAHRDIDAAAARFERRWNDLRAQVAAAGPAADQAPAVDATERAWRDTSARLDRLRNETGAIARSLHEAAVELEHGARTLRLQPFRHACVGLERAVRDLTHRPDHANKQVELTVVGDDVELDGEVVAALRDPLLHLVRNAIAHGIEPAETRQHQSKPAAGALTISATVLGDQVEVAVSDDGAGLDAERLRRRAAERGVDVDDDDDVTHLPWLAGLSTADTTDDLAGRGVGLDAVRDTVEQLGGTTEILSQPGRGCTVRLLVPVALSTLHALLVEVDGQTVALPSTAVRRVVRLDPDAVHSTAGGTHTRIGDELVPVVSLRAFLGLDVEPVREHHHALLVDGATGTAALLVDRIGDVGRLTRRPAHPRLRDAPGLVGTTLLANGETALVLNPLVCLRETASAVAVAQPADEPVQPPRILLAEDSATTRALEQDILEAAGYEVMVAEDGEAAWQLLVEHGADLVVTDVEMPRRDGFALCEAIRGHHPLAQVPVVLVTSRASDEDRHRGVEVGANAYLVKSAFDQAGFLATLRRLL